MKHDIHVKGCGYSLRPVELTDAQTILDIRLEDIERNRYIHAVSSDVSLQEQWIRNYFERQGDYYFVVENNLTGAAEGLIGIYDETDGVAEWGRWVIKKSSFAAIESVYLMLRAAFDELGLKEVYSRTLAENTAVVSFHDTAGEINDGIIKDCFELDGKMYNAVRHHVDKALYQEKLAAELEEKASKIFIRNLKVLTGGLTFHHIGVATESIEKEFAAYKMLRYTRNGSTFSDPQQGIKGLFITANGQPQLELLENLPESHTLDKWLESKTKMYHFAYYVKDIEKCIKVFGKNRIRIISPLKQSTYFGKRICFLMLPNMFMIELMEE